MGSELVRPGAPLEGVRGGRLGVGAEGGLRGEVGGGGAIVAWSSVKSFESIVAAALKSKALPQTEQNLPLEETCAPQDEQYMGAEILPSHESLRRTDGTRDSRLSELVKGYVRPGRLCRRQALRSRLA